MTDWAPFPDGRQDQLNEVFSPHSLAPHPSQTEGKAASPFLLTAEEKKRSRDSKVCGSMCSIIRSDWSSFHLFLLFLSSSSTHPLHRHQPCLCSPLFSNQLFNTPTAPARLLSFAHDFCSNNPRLCLLRNNASSQSLRLPWPVFFLTTFAFFQDRPLPCLNPDPLQCHPPLPFARNLPLPPHSIQQSNSTSVSARLHRLICTTLSLGFYSTFFLLFSPFLCNQKARSFAIFFVSAPVLSLSLRSPLNSTQSPLHL